MAYSIQFKPAAVRQLEQLPRPIRNRIALKIEALRDDPFPPACKKLAGLTDAWRIRVGVYQVQRAILVVLVLTVGHRREVYR